MDSLTIVLAVWGAIVSTVSIVWLIRRDLLDRGQLRVICYVGEIVGGPNPTGVSTPRLVYNVTNRGRRPILVTHIGGAVAKDRHFMVPNAPVPKMLQPGEYFLGLSDLSILDEEPTALWAIDSFGKHWKVPRKQLQYLLREHQERRLKKAE